MSESSNDIVIACTCGQHYSIPTEYVGQAFTCTECGSAVQVPAGASAMAAPSAPTAPPPVAQAAPVKVPVPAIDMRLDGDLEAADPDPLMQEIRQSRMPRTILISLVAHILLVGLTSFGLFADWARYGIMMPAAIQAEKKALDEAEQKRKAQEEADKNDAAAKAGNAAQPEGGQQETGAGTSVGKDQPEAQNEKSNYEKKVMEVSNERPTKSPITGLDGDLDID
jgi:hypothetical protein